MEQSSTSSFSVTDASAFTHRIDVEAAVEPVEVAVGIEATDVACLHPLIDDAFGRRFGVVPGSRASVLRTGDDLAGLHGFVVLVPDLQLSEGREPGTSSANPLPRPHHRNR